jgi:branched-chain amino acid transport system ATP-binding protein
MDKTSRNPSHEQGANASPPASSATPLLRIENLSKAFRGLLALHDYDLSLEEGLIWGVIGPNGAGKTTLFNLITGVLTPTEGKVFFQGQAITNLASHQVARLGVVRTFQNIRLFGPLSVLENVKIGLQMQNKAGLWETILSLPSFGRQESKLEEKAYHLLELFGLEPYWHTAAHSLPFGFQRRLEIASALATHPTLLLLDEPAAGMNPSETDELMALIGRIRDEFALTIMLIEHDMRVIMNICDYIQTLNYGEIIAQGTPEEIQNNSRVIEAYLGGAVKNRGGGVNA